MEHQVSGRVTYNGHGMQEFIPQRTAAYISQHDLHIGEMTVRETLAFSARCQGIGTRYGIDRDNIILLRLAVRMLLLVCQTCADQLLFLQTKSDLLSELSRREKAASIKPDPDIDVFMKVNHRL